jgi:hypothetical protein
MPNMPDLLGRTFSAVDAAGAAFDQMERANGRLALELATLVSDKGDLLKRIHDLEEQNQRVLQDSKRLLRERQDVEPQLVTSGNVTEKVCSQWWDLEARFHAAERGLLDANCRNEQSIGCFVKELGMRWSAPMFTVLTRT